MSKAYIIFADGSKQMAHNLDDSRFRWAEQRKLRYADEILKTHKDGIVIRDCSTVTNIEDAKAWKEEIALQQATLQQHSIYLKSQLKSRLKNQASHISVALVECQLQSAWLSRYIKENSSGDPANNPPDSKRKELFAENARLSKELSEAKDEIIRLQKLLIEQFGIDERIVLRDVS